MMKSPIIIHNTSPVFSTPSDLHFFIKQSKNHQLVGLGSPGNCSLTKNTLKKSTRPENAWHAYSQIRKGLDWYKRNWSKHILALKKKDPIAVEATHDGPVKRFVCLYSGDALLCAPTNVKKTSSLVGNVAKD
jgi:hypothetical protein